MNQRPSHLSTRIIGVFLLLASGCASGEDASANASATLTAAIGDSAGVKIVQLSHSLLDVAEGRVHADLLEPDLVVGETDDEAGVWFGAVADVSAMANGRFAVLDQMQARIMLLDSLGRLEGTLGRKGRGPAELQEPWALARVGPDAFVVRESGETVAFKVFKDQKIHAVIPSAPEGDWYQPRVRMPRAKISGYNFGPEDITRRLRPLGDSTFLHMLQKNELARFDYANPIEFPDGNPAVLVRYGLDGRIIDTIAQMMGAPALVQSVWPGRSIFHVEPLFVERPQWTTGRGWYALGHGNSTSVTVYRHDGTRALSIRFPEGRRPVREEDRVAAADWWISSTYLNTPGGLDILRRRGGTDRLHQVRAETLTDIHRRWADSVPYVTGIYGAGRCLFLSGFDPDDWQDGTSLTWTVIDAERGELMGNIRLRAPIEGTMPDFPEFQRFGASLRDFGTRFAYTLRRMPDGASAIERFRLPMECGE